MDQLTIALPVLTKRYLEALHYHVGGEEERARMIAYDLGREALRSDLGIVRLVSAFAEALNEVVRERPTPEELSRIREAVADLLEDAVVPFHMALRASGQEAERLREIREGLLARLVEAEEGERRRIANDIHDDSIQVMVTAHMRLSALAAQETDPQRRSTLEGVQEAVNRAIARLRRLMFELVPPGLEDEPLSVVLRRYLEQMRKDWGTDFHLEDRLSDEPPHETRLILYRISQEALTNVRKHARADGVEVILEQRNRGFLVRIADDGIGFSPAMVEAVPGVPHLGLGAMRERADLSGGWFQVQSAPGAGTTVEFWIPHRRGSAGGETIT